MRLRRSIAIGLALGIATLAGCRRTQPGADANVIHSSAKRGPVTVDIEARPAAVLIGDLVTVTVSAEAPAGYLVTLPGETEIADPNSATVRPLESPEPRPGPTGVVWRRRFTLEPLNAGTLELPELSVRYTTASSTTASQPAPGAAGTQPTPTNELITDPLKIEVRSALTNKDHPDQPRDITGTLTPPRPPRPWWVDALAAGALAGVLAGAYAGWRTLRRWQQRPAPPILPEIWALRELERLAADGFASEHMREYYYRLTEVVRSYIERKFALAAPERTTEEFLVELTRNQGALPYDAARLRAFLEACDFVKYAALQPRREDADQALSTARAFVHATAAAPRPEGAHP
jgi:hypothetical protein